MQEDRGYLGDPNLRQAYSQYEYTPEQIQEIIKCSEDPIYFIKTYAKIVHIDHGIVPFNLYKCQEKLINSYNNNRKTVALTCRQAGKCFSLNTEITLKHENYNNGKPFRITVGEFYNWLKFKEEARDLLRL